MVFQSKKTNDKEQNKGAETVIYFKICIENSVYQGQQRQSAVFFALFDPVAYLA